MRQLAFIPSQRSSRRQVAVVSAAVVSAGFARRQRPVAGMVVLGGLVGYELGSYALKVLAQEGELRAARRRHEEEILRSLASEGVSGRVHDPITIVHEALEQAGVPHEMRRDLEGVLGELRKIASARAANSESLAAFIERPDGPLDRYGTRAKVEWAPEVTQRPLLFAGKVLDEVRLLHTADIEYAALIHTLSARAVLVAFAPLLSRTSAVPSPLGDSRFRAASWATLTAWAASVGMAAPQVATLVMDRGAPGIRARRLLLEVEIPLSLMAAVASPSWPVIAFASGWANYSQRPGPHVYPTRLIAFVGATVTAQAVGLRLSRTSIGRAGAEIVSGLAVIGLIGGSYGAMGPLSVATLLRSILSEASRSERAARFSDEILIRAARQMRDLADRLDAGESDPATRRAISALRNEASIVAGEKLSAPLELQQLVENAISSASPPVTIGAPTFSSRDLRSAAIREQIDADILAAAIRHCHAEAIRHGREEVLTDLRVKADRLIITVCNEIKPESEGGTGHGQRLLRDLVEQLPHGLLDQPGERIAEGGHTGMWDVRFSCAVALFDRPLDQQR